MAFADGSFCTFDIGHDTLPKINFTARDFNEWANQYKNTYVA